MAVRLVVGFNKFISEKKSYIILMKEVYFLAGKKRKFVYPNNFFLCMNQSLSRAGFFLSKLSVSGSGRKKLTMGPSINYVCT